MGGEVGGEVGGRHFFLSSFWENVHVVFVVSINGKNGIFFEVD